MDNPTEAPADRLPHGSESADPPEPPTENMPAIQESLETSPQAAPKARRRTQKCSLCGNLAETFEHSAVPLTTACEACGFRLVWAASDASSGPVPDDQVPDSDEGHKVEELDRWLSSDPVQG